MSPLTHYRKNHLEFLKTWRKLLAVKRSSKYRGCVGSIDIAETERHCQCFPLQENPVYELSWEFFKRLRISFSRMTVTNYIMKLSPDIIISVKTGAFL